MYVGSLPPTTVYNSWHENIEITSADDEVVVDLTELTEIVIQLIDQTTKFVEMQLMLSQGSITLPAPGIIEWFVPAGAMRTLVPKLYEVVLTLTKDDETIVMVLGTVSVIE